MFFLPYEHQTFRFCVKKKMHIKDFQHVQMIPTTQFSPAFVNNASKQNLKKTTVGVVRIIEAGVDIILL